MKVAEQKKLARSQTKLGTFDEGAWAEARRKHLEKNKK